MTLLKSLAPNLPYCKFDMVRIHEVFLNILQNSLEAIGDDGVMQVKTWANGDQVCVKITDDGPGIVGEQLNKIFTPFFTTKEDGSGLGLAFAHRIIKDHGGNISVASSKGKGTSVLVSLPAVRVTAKV